MDGIIVVALIFWVLSAVSKSAQKKKAAQSAQVPSAPRPKAKPPQDVAQPLRPIQVDLPGQRTMPSHWGTYSGTPDSMMAQEEAFARMLYMDEKVRPMDQATQREEREAADRKEAVIPGLGLAFNAESLVQGVIFSEILTRPMDRRKR